MIFGCGEVNLIDSLLLNRTALYLSYCEEERRAGGKCRLRGCQEPRIRVRANLESTSICCKGSFQECNAESFDFANVRRTKGTRHVHN